MKRNTLYRLLILTFFILITTSCKKDTDYLKKYTGSFTFTVTFHSTIWFQNFDTSYTSTYNGQISLYDEKHRQLSINYESGLAITPEVSETGEFVNQSSGGADYSGKFTNPDEVHFGKFSQSAGFSASESITGKRN